ncbi:hypothetical protein BIW11_04490 [Tropilaelaps mercedesae]|uniref:Myb/SANT-like DNA-binding domain-containing protein n=1 Tax=Tropilaelaps mercedesae TaxID=418985 RepID=A0A1V9X617_9ACAR|nr:hypothetical protein BIW11_04490 [Tropilaelaps mercedesae]
MITVIDGGSLAGPCVTPLISPSTAEFIHTQAATDPQTHPAPVSQLTEPLKDHAESTSIESTSSSQGPLPRGVTEIQATRILPTSGSVGTGIVTVLTTNSTTSTTLATSTTHTITLGPAATSNQKLDSAAPTGNEDDRRGTGGGMLIWTPELVSVLVECYVASMQEAGVGAQKKRVYEQVADQVHSRTGVPVTGEQVGNKIKFMRKQHMTVKAMLMSNKHVPGAKMTPHFKALDDVFSKDNTSAPLNRALEKCLGGKVKVIPPTKGIQGGSSSGTSGSSIVVVQQRDERNSLGSAFSHYIAKLIDELADDQRDEVQEYILSFIFGVKQQSRQQQQASAAASISGAANSATPS